MRSILLVCTANICRSPMAEGILSTLLASAGLRDQIEVASAGTHDYHVGSAPFPAAVEAVRARGYQINTRCARRVTPNDFDHFDCILVMDKSNLTNLLSIAPTRSKQKIELLTEYADKYHGGEVPDPYGGRPEDFERAIDIIEEACRGLVSILARQLFLTQGRSI